MLRSEAQVLIVDDDPGKADDLAAMIAERGGKVVGYIDDFDTAVAELSDPGFPEAPDQRNVVLLDGSMQRGSHTDGSRLFTLGRRRGWLHGVTEHAPGVLAVSCSLDRRSEVGYDTGATVSDRDPVGWAKVLDGQIPVPEFAPDGAIERELLSGMDIMQTMQIALGGQAVKRLAMLRFSRPGREGEEPTVHEFEASELVALSAPQILMQVMSGRGGPKAARKFAKYQAFTAHAVMETETNLIVISRDQRPNPYHEGGYLTDPILTDCAFDRMRLATLDQIPAPYWTDRDLDPSQF